VKVDGEHYRTIWCEADGSVHVIDQRALPFRFETVAIETATQMAEAIATMTVRGAGLIGVAGGYGIYLAAREAAAAGAGEAAMRARVAEAAARLLASRPTAVNLAWAVDRQLRALEGITEPARLVARAAAEAAAIADEDADHARRIGEHGLEILRRIHEDKGDVVNVLTHCNAGWLAFVDHGSATAPIYAAHDAGIPVHVWVDETRPRGQGARLTAWELGQHGVPHTVITDNAGGHLMQHGLVDVVITGSDRTSATGDVANKIGTYLKALAAHDNGVPFYVALPSSSIDWDLHEGVGGTPIEVRDPREVTHVEGETADGAVVEVRVVPAGTAAANHAFDVTPARLVTGLITERGTCAATAEGIAALFPDR
jgi:methylthioribose-1-phosphate isomerase